MLNRLVFLFSLYTFCFASFAFAETKEHSFFLLTQQKEKIEPFLQNQKTEGDFVILKSGEILQGHVQKVPSLVYYLGKQKSFTASEISVINFKSASQVQYILRDGQVFSGLLAAGKILFIPQGCTYAMNIKCMTLEPTEIDFIYSPGKYKRPKAKSKTKTYSLILRRGDHFSCYIENYSITIKNGSKMSKLPVHKLSDVRVRENKLIGCLQSEVAPVATNPILLQDKTLTVRFIGSHERIIIPWCEIDRIIADNGMWNYTHSYFVPESTRHNMVYVPAGTFIFGDHSFDSGASMSSEERIADPLLYESMVLSKNSMQSIFSIAESDNPSGMNVAAEKEMHVPAFYVDKYTVTNEKYLQFVLATDHRTPVHWINNQIPDGLQKHPVVNVSYADAQAYAAWSEKRLPTEQEWERIAKWDHGYNYPYGEEYNKMLANTESSSTKEVGSYENVNNSVSKYLPQDLSGNVAEWTVSDYSDDPQLKVVKGGSFCSHSYNCTSTYRGILHQDDFNAFTGFRCVCDAQQGSVLYQVGH